MWLRIRPDAADRTRRHTLLRSAAPAAWSCACLCSAARCSVARDAAAASSRAARARSSSCGGRWSGGRGAHANNEHSASNGACKCAELKTAQRTAQPRRARARPRYPPPPAGCASSLQVPPCPEAGPQAAWASTPAAWALRPGPRSGGCERRPACAAICSPACRTSARAPAMPEGCPPAILLSPWPLRCGKGKKGNVRGRCQFTFCDFPLWTCNLET